MAEVMVSLIVFIVAVVGLVAMEARGVEAQRASMETREGERLAQEVMSELLATGYDELVQFDFAGGQNPSLPYSDVDLGTEQLRDYGAVPNATGERPPGMRADFFWVGRRIDRCVTLDNGVSWSSTTKAFGFAALRAGWVVTRDREFAHACRSASNYFHVDPPLAALALATQVLQHADVLNARANATIAVARAVMDRWMAAETRLTWVAPSAGQTGLIRLPALTADVEFARHLLDRYGTRVVPGTMFEAPGTVRVSFNLPSPDLEQALATISAALDDFQRGGAVEL